MRKNARTTNADESREKVALLTSAAGAALGTLLKGLEKEGGNLSAEDFEKVFGFLNRTLKSVEAQARKDRIAISAGQFDFDAVVTAAPNASEPAAPPSGISPPQTPQAPTPASAPDKPADWKKPTGRVSKNSPNTELAGKAVHTNIATGAITERLAPKAGDDKSLAGTLIDKTDNVAFLD